jgi:8-oxo-dGTP diphosphatase
LIRHFTASGVVLRDDSVLLIEHRKLGLWLCPGGHLEPDEDPAQAVVREVAEETGLVCDIIARPSWFRHAGTTILPSPFAICVYDVPADAHVGPHQHIDMVYVLNPAAGTLTPQDSEVSRCEWVPLAEVAGWGTPDEVPALVISAAAYAPSLARPAWSTMPGCLG